MRGSKSNADREKEDRRRRHAWRLEQIIVPPWIRRRFNYSFVGFEPGKIKEPVLIAINHSCAYDPVFVGMTFRHRPLTFIASEHLLRMKPWGPLLDRYESIIPHQKGAKGSRTALVTMKRIKRGESIFLAVEGEQTWDGRSLPVMPYTGRLARASGATLVTYKLEGAYLSMPRWASNPRKGKIYGHPVNVYSPKDLKEMSDEEVEAAIANDLRFDIWEWQRTKPGGPISFKSKYGNAEGLERAVFTCPSCGSFSGLRSDGDYIGCGCGFKLRLEDTGFFDPPRPFETIVDWEACDRAALKDRLEECAEDPGGSDEQLVFSDGGVTLIKIGEGHKEEWSEAGGIALDYRNGGYELSAPGHSFRVEEISEMTMVLAGRIVLSDKSGYYEIRSSKGRNVNLRKYVIAGDLIRSK